ncbi:JmjC domain-containing protein, partial [Haematococcus lacustris]
PGGCEGRAGQGLWGPFLAFLRRRRSVVLEELREADRAPSWLLREVEQYLPEDVACLAWVARYPS